MIIPSSIIIVAACALDWKSFKSIYSTLYFITYIQVAVMSVPVYLYMSPPQDLITLSNRDVKKNYLVQSMYVVGLTNWR